MSDEAEVRDDWWHVVLATPIMVAVGVILGGAIQVLLVGCFLVLYPIAVKKDMEYIQSVSTDWEPSSRFWLIWAVLSSLTLGVLSFLVTPLYLLKRYRLA